MAKSVRSGSAGGPKNSPVKVPAAAKTKDEEYSDDFFGDDPFATTGGEERGGLSHVASSAKSSRSMLRSKSTLPVGFRMPGLAPPNLPGPNEELPEYTQTLVPQVTLSKVNACWSSVTGRQEKAVTDRSGQAASPRSRQSFRSSSRTAVGARGEGTAHPHARHARAEPPRVADGGAAPRSGGSRHWTQDDV